MDDLVRWLTACLDEDERTARAIPLDLGHHWCDPGPWVMAGNGGGGREAEVAKAADGLEMPLAEHVAHHIAAHDPARVLREIKMKRALVAAYADALTVGPDVQGGYKRPIREALARQARNFLLVLALPFVDRPGFQEAWRP